MIVHPAYANAEEDGAGPSVVVVESAGPSGSRNAVPSQRIGGAHAYS